MDIAIGNLSELTSSNVKRGKDESDYPLLNELLRYIAEQYDNDGKEYTIDDLASGKRLCDFFNDYIQDVKMPTYYSSSGSNPFWADNNLSAFGRACEEIQVPRTCIASSNDFKDRNFAKIELMLVIVIVRCMAYTSQIVLNDKTMQMIRDYKLGQYPERERDRRVCDNILDVFRNKGNNKDIPVTESSDSEEESPKPRDPIQSTQTTVGSEEKQVNDMPNKELTASKEESVPDPKDTGLGMISDDEVDEVGSGENLPEPVVDGVNLDKRGVSSDEEKGKSQGSAVVQTPKSVISDDEVDEVTMTSENLPNPEPEGNLADQNLGSDEGSDVDEVIEEPRRGSRPVDPRSMPSIELTSAVANEPGSISDDEVDEVEKPAIFATTAMQGENREVPKVDAAVKPPKVDPVPELPKNDNENLPMPDDTSESEPESEPDHEPEPEPDSVPISNDPFVFTPDIVPNPTLENGANKPMAQKSIQNPTQPIVVPELPKKEDKIKQMQSIKPHEIKWYIVTLFILLMVICLAGMITCGVWLAKLH